MITIRELQTDDDLNAVLKLCRDFFGEYTSHHEEFFDLDDLCDDDISGRFWESLDSDDSATIVALVDDKIVGYTSLAIRKQPRFYKIKKIGAISAWMVAKEFRRRGIATALLTEAGDFFRRNGITYYTFYTAVANQGTIRLYDKLGMKPLHMAFLGRT